MWQEKEINLDSPEIVAHSPKMRNLITQALKFCQSNAPLLIQGETGTGKDLIAKACHNSSPRRAHKFIAINCAGLPSEHAESEMFGRSENGKTAIGFFESADGGTVLLDSIAELSLALQAKLLRFLTDGTFRRVGDEQGNYANVRVICTSQIPLQHYVDQGKMRSDLFHRLNVLSLTLPPLRERKEDLPDLVQHFLQQISHTLHIEPPPFDGEFMAYLQNYPWSGNVRELYNALYRACSLMEKNSLSINDLNLTEMDLMPKSLDEFEGETLEQIMSRFEATVLRKFYEKYPSTRKLATRLGVSHTAIANKLRQYNIGK